MTPTCGRRSGPPLGVVITERPNLDGGPRGACSVKKIVRHVKTCSKALFQSSQNYPLVVFTSVFQ